MFGEFEGWSGDGGLAPRLQLTGRRSSLSLLKCSRNWDPGIPDAWPRLILLASSVLRPLKPSSLLAT